MKKSIGAQTILYPTPVLLVGTYDEEGRPNAMTAAWGGICCSSPPAVAVSLRKATYSYGSLMQRMAFTINIPSENLAKEADYMGMASGRSEDKFAKTGLTHVRAEHVDAPFIQECPMVLECRVIHTIEIGLHTQFIGEIMDVKVDQEVLHGTGLPDPEKVKPILYAPVFRAYYGLGKAIGKAFSIGKGI